MRNMKNVDMKRLDSSPHRLSTKEKGMFNGKDLPQPLRRRGAPNGIWFAMI